MAYIELKTDHLVSDYEQLALASKATQFTNGTFTLWSLNLRNRSVNCRHFNQQNYLGQNYLRGSSWFCWSESIQFFLSLLENSCSPGPWFLLASMQGGSAILSTHLDLQINTHYLCRDTDFFIFLLATVC